MTKSERFMLCCLGEDPLIADGSTMSLAPVLEKLSVAVCPDASAARRRVGEGRLASVWVASCEGVEPINLAAACKCDSPQTTVYLVTADRGGSVASRAQAAAIDGVVHPTALGDHMLGVAARGIAGGREERSREALALPEPDGGKRASRPLEACETSRTGFLLTVVSGSGGAGKSTVATLAAFLGACRGLRTALIDGDLQFGDLAALAGEVPSASIEDVAAARAVPEELAEAPLVLFTAPRALERSEIVAEVMGPVVDVVGDAFDFVVVNTGGGWGEEHLLLLERSAASLFLVDQRASSVRACRHALNLCLRCGVATGSFLIAVNRCARHAPFTSIDVSSALDGAHVVELADGGREVEELLGAGLARNLVDDSNPLCASIEAVLGELLSFAPRPAGAGVQASLARIGLAPKAVGAESSRRRKRKERTSRRGRELVDKAH